MLWRNKLTPKILSSGLIVLTLLGGADVYAQKSGANQTTVATVPRLIRYPGELPKSPENSSTEILGITFAIYGEEFEGTPLWREVQSVHVDNEGKYVVELGNATPGGLPADLFSSGEQRWLGVQVNGEQEQPRELFLSVPYALSAGDAQTLGGLPASAFVQVAQPLAAGASAAMAGVSPAATAAVTTAGGTVNKLAKFSAVSQIASSQVVDTGTNVGIGNTAPAAKLDVTGNGIFRGSLSLPSTAAATATAGTNSSTLSLAGSAFNSSTKAATTQTFSWRVDPVGNNTATPTGKLNLLYGTTPTGFTISNKGIISFASGQTFPNMSANGPVLAFTAPPEFTVTGSPVNGIGTIAMNWKVPPSTNSAPGSIVKRDVNGDLSTARISVGTFSAGELLMFQEALNTSLLDVENTATTGASDALDAHTSSLSGAAVSATASGGGIAVKGLASGTQAFSGQGVWGESAGTANGANGFGPDGVDGISHSPGGSGVAAFNDKSGVALFAAASAPGLAGHFIGDVLVTGKISKSGGSFIIDHPLEPADKFLSHSFVESPDMMNIYNGEVTTDGRGDAVVTLPDYFEALNRDFRYQLSVIGQFAEVIVAREVVHNQFSIRTNKPNVRVSWQICGVRQDAWANAHRIPVEVEKLGEEKGHYLHPELFGADEDASISMVHHPGATKMMKAAREGKPMIPVLRPAGRAVSKPGSSPVSVTTTATSTTKQ